MTFSRTIRLRVGYKWIAILLFTCALSLPTDTPGDKLRYTLRFCARLPEIDDVRNPLIAHAVIASPEQHGCSKEHTR